ncbi:MAG: thiamine phosphate synthase [Acidobacteria bacterium]|nr:MAG: thiamine phosphate synthase [Acidobacteriota bacterium]REJ99243.1 MAG: thiamine phosphate synthase [Acidobacteriota bacterium]REK16036.1 MAG: thiamine phosphate synthase [Acidobacteriota bacterium]REK43717.1 MAG: thiamine phosphate synthase [Acidobacteriota bacterium]
MFSLPKVYPITDTSLSSISHSEQIFRLADGGARLVQIREKLATSAELYKASFSAMQFARSRGLKIIINDRADIALAVGADGVHLGQDDLPPREARALLGGGAIIGCSTHSMEQARIASSEPVDYIAIGPVFPTTTKKDPDPIVGLEGVAAAKRLVGSIPLVAIGGIDTTNFKEVLDAGADSVAVVGGILRHPEGIQAAIREFLN